MSFTRFPFSASKLENARPCRHLGGSFHKTSFYDPIFLRYVRPNNPPAHCALGSRSLGPCQYGSKVPVRGGPTGLNFSMKGSLSFLAAIFFLSFGTLEAATEQSALKALGELTDADVGPIQARLGRLGRTLSRGQAVSQLKPIEWVDSFLEAQEKAAKGYEDYCNSAAGYYRLTDSRSQRLVRFSYVERGIAVLLGPNRYRAILRYEEVDSSGNETFKGLLIETEDGWYWTRLNEGITHPYPSTTFEGGTLPAFEDYYLRREIPQGATVERLEFTPDRTLAVSEAGTRLEYAGDITVAEYIAENGNAVNAFSLIMGPNIRIPPGMYTLLEDPGYIQAREERLYSTMYDMLFTRAFEIAKGNIEHALLISLLTVDLRDRGLCGAIRGRRGRGLVPKGIFDREVPEKSVIGNRLDAGQHFFGYALLAQYYRSEQLMAYSHISKGWEPYKYIGRFFRTLHGGDLDTGYDPAPMGIITETIYKGDDLKLRPEFDKNADIHYNRLGTAFGERLGQDPSTMPSQVINDPDFDVYEAAMGLPPDTERASLWTFHHEQ